MLPLKPEHDYVTSFPNRSQGFGGGAGGGVRHTPPCPPGTTEMPLSLQSLSLLRAPLIPRGKKKEGKEKYFPSQPKLML